MLGEPRIVFISDSPERRVWANGLPKREAKVRCTQPRVVARDLGGLCCFRGVDLSTPTRQLALEEKGEERAGRGMLRFISQTHQSSNSELSESR